MSFEFELTALISKHSLEGDTPDFILASYLLDCLSAYKAAQRRRAEWFTQPRAEAEPTLEDLRIPPTVAVRVSRILENLGVKTLDDLCAVKASTLRRTRNCGPGAYQAITLALARLGRSLAPDHIPTVKDSDS